MNENSFHWNLNNHSNKYDISTILLYNDIFMVHVFNDAIYREILLREIQGNRIARLRPIDLFCIKLDTIKSLSFYEEKDTYNKVQKYISNINLFKFHFDKFFPDDESSRVFEC